MKKLNKSDAKIEKGIKNKIALLNIEKETILSDYDIFRYENKEAFEKVNLIDSKISEYQTLLCRLYGIKL